MNARASQEAAAGSAAVGSLLQLGETLRSAREARGVNLEEAATRLRLAPRVIRSLEDGSFEQLPAATYARGYIRAYANFLGLAADPLLQAYERYADKPPELNPFASSPPPQVQATDLPVRAVTYGVSVVVLGLLGVWLWQTQQFSAVESLSIPKWGGDASVAEQPLTEPIKTVPVTPAVAPAEQTASPPSGNDTGDGVAAAVPVAPALPAAPPASTTSTDGSDATASTMAPVAGTSNSESAIPPPAAGDSPTAPADTATGPEAALAVNAPGMQIVPATGEIPYATPSPSPATADSGSQADPTAIGVATGPQALSFDLAEDSWIEVYDAEDKRLYYNIGRQGTRVAVQGVLPYRVKVGNAPAVLVSYQGHSLDITAFSNGAVARFQVTPDGFLAQP
jgi:cytoskeleton protein RodZ